MSSNGQGNLFEAADIEPHEKYDIEDERFLYKVEHEIHRLMGLLRFSPDSHGVYTARCEPDHFILPALGPHFKERFGKTPWAIIDEKRRVCIRCLSGTLEFFKINCNPDTAAQYPEASENPDSSLLDSAPPNGEWENLWRLYHKTINNESRNNPNLQRQFMPKRYWKYLTEVE